MNGLVYYFTTEYIKKNHRVHEVYIKLALRFSVKNSVCFLVNLKFFNHKHTKKKPQSTRSLCQISSAFLCEKLGVLCGKTLISRSIWNDFFYNKNPTSLSLRFHFVYFAVTKNKLNLNGQDK